MSTYYRALKLHDGNLSLDQDGQPTYTAAMASIAAKHSITTGPHAEYRVLLDVGSVGGDDLHKLLLNDPLLSAIYKLGRAHGRSKSSGALA